MRVLNIKNVKIGKITAIEIHHKDKNNRNHWLCKCDCGGSKIIRGDIFAKNKITSCGCERVAHNRINRRPFAIVKRLYLSSIHKRHKSLKFNLNDIISLELFETLVFQNCFYCNISPSQIIKDNKFNGKRTSNEFIVVNGIDRVNNAAGYTKDNVVSCCKDCNTAKNVMSRDVFMNFIQRVYNHNFNKSQ